MNENYLEVTYRGGEPLAAYLYLPRRDGDRSARVEAPSPGLLVDLADDGRPIALEITIPGLVRIDEINRVLASFGIPPVRPCDLAPLRSAA